MGVFKSDGRYIYLDISYCELYIPQYYFDSGWASKSTKSVRSLGLFNIGLFENGKLKEMRIFNLPTFTDFFMYESEERVMDFEGSPNTECFVLKYIKGQKILEATCIQDSTNAETYLDMITKGKVPTTIPYEDTLRVWEKNQVYNAVNFGVPSMVSEMILAVSYRDKNDLSKKFASVIGRDPKTSQFDYATANIRQICQYGSTFTAMTFEDINSMITTSINRTREKKEEMESPVEKVIKY